MAQGGNSALGGDTLNNVIKDYQNFLSIAPHQVFNLKPDEDGVVSVDIQDLGNYNQLFIIGCDSDSCVSRNMELKSLFAHPDSNPIPMRDLS